MLRSTLNRPPRLYLVKHEDLQLIRRRRKLRELQTVNRLVYLLGIPALLGLALFTSPHFRVQRLSVQGAERVDESAVRRAGQYLLGRNFLLAQPTRWRQALLRMAPVREVRVSRWPPWPLVPRTALTIQVVERTPTFALRDSSDRTLATPPSLLVDHEGFIFDRERALPRVPVVDFEGVKVNVGERLAADRLDAVLMVLRELDTAKISEVAAVAFDRQGFASLTLHDGAAVRLGDEEWARKLRLLPGALTRLRHNGGPVEYIDLTTLRAPVWKPAERKS
jgi:cell division septal protein FtsQ